MLKNPRKYGAKILKTFETNEKVEIQVALFTDPNFDKACERAYDRAISIFGVNEDGHFENVPKAHRSDCSLVVEFVRYRHIGGMGGHEFLYEFAAWADAEED